MNFSARAKKRILFIEDEAEIVVMMKMRLEAHDYEVISASDGEEGLKRAQQDKPDLILLDIIIPKIDGLTLCKRLKSEPKTKDIPVIMVSGSGQKHLSEKYRAAGADDLIVKPFEAKEVLEKLAKHLGE